MISRLNVIPLLTFCNNI